ncbi:MAG: HAMP domain-containing histidine kinase [Actinobacteria bacterium]|nr:HAMP domain-containing histidine kinase [Actinomycetota bacterium]
MNAARDVRTRLLLVVLSAVTLALAVATIGFNVLLAASTDGSASSLLRQRADSERGQLRIVGGRIQQSEGSSDPLGDSRVWIYDSRGRAIERPNARAKTAVAAASLSSGPSRFVTVGSTDERLFSFPIVSRGVRYGTIVAGLSLSPYEETRRTALLASLIFAASVLAITGAAAAWLLRSALRPVFVMTQQAEAWSEHDLDKRFELGEPHDELTRLGHTLDQLLDRIAASLRHERRFSAELSHELRTPLAKLSAEAELALRRPREPEEYRRVIGDILANARQIARIVEALLAAAHQEAGPRGIADATEIASAAAAACRPLADERGIELVVVPSQRLRVGVDLDLAERIVHPVLENACRYGGTRVQMSLARGDGVVVITIDDDGPGLTEGEEERIFEPATRGDAGVSSGPSAGLGLALARRLARSVSGEVLASDGAPGARFVVRLPAA